MGVTGLVSDIHVRQKVGERAVTYNLSEKCNRSLVDSRDSHVFVMVTEI